VDTTATSTMNDPLAGLVTPAVATSTNKVASTFFIPVLGFGLVVDDENEGGALDNGQHLAVVVIHQEFSIADSRPLVTVHGGEDGELTGGVLLDIFIGGVGIGADDVGEGFVELGGSIGLEGGGRPKRDTVEAALVDEDDVLGFGVVELHQVIALMLGDTSSTEDVLVLIHAEWDDATNELGFEVTSLNSLLGLTKNVADGGSSDSRIGCRLEIRVCGAKPI